VVAGLLTELDEWRARLPQIELDGNPEIQLSEEKVEELRALGYVE
jgi:hypothetical protein